MHISVVNLTKDPHKITTADVLRTIRAVNRQLREDFAPYWSIQAELRLVSKADDQAGDERREHPSLRGDGILYLISDLDTSEYLGYHALHHAGIPFGFVCTAVSDQLGEPWSITLSHEALEMVADAETNLLCKGPHPDPTKGYDVYHWFEICDAVQAESYPLDGIEVSNFVLPLYYTGGDELDGRNDYLDLESGSRVRSFGVKPGGYVGFFDPVTGSDDTYEADVKARTRAQVRGLLTGVRRRDRRPVRKPMVIRLPGASPRARAEMTGPAAPRFEGLYLKVPSAGKPPAAERLAKAIVARLLGTQFTVEPFWDEGNENEFLVSKLGDAVPANGKKPAARRRLRGAVPRKELNWTIKPAAAWELTYALREDRDVLYAEPLFAVQLAPIPDAVSKASGGGGSKHLPESDPARWSLAMVRADRVWAATKKGLGIRIGHPDTGYTDHPSLLPALEKDAGFDFLDDDGDAMDDLGEQLGPEFPGHGTATASVIAVPDAAAKHGEKVMMCGVAPAATIVPYRVSRSVVLLSTKNLARAIRRAADSGVHVISISMGGLLSSALHSAVRHAVSKGVIVVAAAGNKVGFVVWPAAYDEVIAVAACNAVRRPWEGSSHGSAVDATAPGESVWRALTQKGGDGKLAFSTDRSSGTSYAAATMAGVAALWLAKHGRAALIAKYTAEGLCGVFKELLRTHGCDAEPGLPQGEFGAGIVNAEKLLAAPLPKTAPAHGMRRAAVEPVPPRAGTFTLLAHVVPEVPRSALLEGIRRWMQVPEDGVPGPLAVVGEEIAFHVATNPDLRATIVNDATNAHLARRGMSNVDEDARAPRQFLALGSTRLRQELGERRESALQSAKICCAVRPDRVPRTRDRRGFSLEGPWNIGDPVHETITARALRLGGLAPEGAVFEDDAVWEYVRGVFWNDDAQGLLFDEDDERTDNFSNGSAFALLFKRGEREAAPPDLRKYRAGDPLLLRSHFGDLQFLHAMAESDAEPREETRRKILEWARFAWKVATGAIAPDLPLAKTKDKFVVGLQLLPDPATVSELFLVNGIGDVKRRAFGSLLHVVQDSFAARHAVREPLAGRRRGAIVSFCSYGAQDHEDHAAHDRWAGGDGEAEMIDRLDGGRDAVDACARLAAMLHQQRPETEVSLYLEKKLFALT